MGVSAQLGQRSGWPFLVEFLLARLALTDLAADLLQGMCVSLMAWGGPGRIPARVCAQLTHIHKLRDRVPSSWLFPPLLLLVLQPLPLASDTFRIHRCPENWILSPSGKCNQMTV